MPTATRPTPDQESSQNRKARLAGGAKADAAEPIERPVVPEHRKDPGTRAVVEVAAADERARCASGVRPGETLIVITKGAPGPTRMRRQRYPLGHPLRDVPHHVESSRVGDAVGPDPRQVWPSTVRVAILRPRIGSRIRGSQGGDLPLGIARQALE